MNSQNKDNFMLYVLICSLAVILTAPALAAPGIWYPLALSGDTLCSQNNHVMCSANGSTYDPGQNLVPYSDDDDGTSNFYCVISHVSGTSTFGFINGSEYNISNFTDLRNNHNVLLEEQNYARTYQDGLPARHFDENCNGFEMFERNEKDQLNLTKYTENGVVFDVMYSDSNIDDFDLLAKDSAGELLNFGTYLTGTFIDDNSNVPIAGVNVTLYFRNSQGTTKPYLSFISDSKGFFQTNNPRVIDSGIDFYPEVFQIPKTQYIVITKHPKYEDFVANIDLSETAIDNQTFRLTPFGVCQSDCTFEGSSICRAECQGINSCSFSDIGGNWSVVASAIDGKPKDSQIVFTYDSNTYKATACTGVPIVDNTANADTVDSSCAGNKASWKTSEIFVLDGQVVRAVVTNCQE